MPSNKCHYVTDKTIGKVLIPYCWPVINSGDKRDCTCSDFPTTVYGFEKKRFNEILAKKDQYILLLEKENKKLQTKLDNTIMKKKQIKQKELAEKIVELFNSKYPVGSTVKLRKSMSSSYEDRIVANKAYVASSLDPVAFFEGLSGYYLVTKDFVKYD